MKTILAISVLAVGILAAPNAKAVHTCGQMLGSCLAHFDPIVLPKPVKPVPPAKPLKVEKVKPALVPIDPTKSK